MYRVLLVEDDSAIAKIIQYYLNEDGNYQVVWARNAAESIAASKEKFDIILLDVVLPEVNGLELCRTLRLWHSCPIIFISCVDDTNTIVQALELGGDDYLVKPFENKELLARIKANIRRAAAGVSSSALDSLSVGPFRLDVEKKTLFKGEADCRLLSTEFRILSLLMSRPNHYYNAGELYEQVWGKPSYGDSRTVMVHIYNIRRKIETDPKNPRFLKSMWGKGYYFDAEEAKRG